MPFSRNILNVTHEIYNRVCLATRVPARRTNLAAEGHSGMPVLIATVFECFHQRAVHVRIFSV
jgi:hypothetical protein